MMNLLQVIIANPLLTTVISIITIVGFYLTYKSTPQKKLKFIISDNELITKKHTYLSKLSINYDNQNVDKITVTKITFWNASFPTINDTDIVNAAPLSIIGNNCEILETSLLSTNDSSNQVDVTIKENNVARISFDYLDRKEGGMIQIVHTGDKDSLDICGKIKGGKIVIKKNPKKSILRTILESFISVFIATSSSIIYLMFEEFTDAPPTVNYIIFIVALIILSAIVIHFFGKEFIPKNCKVNKSKPLYKLRKDI